MQRTCVLRQGFNIAVSRAGVKQADVAHVGVVENGLTEQLRAPAVLSESSA